MELLGASPRGAQHQLSLLRLAPVLDKLLYLLARPLSLFPGVAFPRSILHHGLAPLLPLHFEGLQEAGNLFCVSSIVQPSSILRLLLRLR